MNVFILFENDARKIHCFGDVREIEGREGN